MLYAVIILVIARKFGLTVKDTYGRRQWQGIERFHQFARCLTKFDLLFPLFRMFIVCASRLFNLIFTFSFSQIYLAQGPDIPYYFPSDLDSRVQP